MHHLEDEKDAGRQVSSYGPSYVLTEYHIRSSPNRAACSTRHAGHNSDLEFGVLRALLLDVDLYMPSCAHVHVVSDTSRRIVGLQTFEIVHGGNKYVHMKR